MSLILCAALMQSAFLAAEPAAAAPQEVAAAKTGVLPATESAKKTEAEAEETYAKAHRVTVKTGKPLVVMVGADWCGPCQTMRRAILPRVREHGLFRKITFAHVNVDRDKELANQLTGGGAAVPQLVMFRKTKNGWARRKMIGGQSVEAVEKFINEGLAMDADERRAEAADPHANSDIDPARDENRRG
ncbi:MAG: thioredoxin family protein [Pirellulales bacterium]|nr:thioredoxin family protein [Pirellulales bacterium]